MKACFAFTIMCSMLFLNSCKKDEVELTGQDALYTEFQVEYDANTNSTIASAKFRQGSKEGILVELNSTEHVYFNGGVMYFDKNANYYKYELGEYSEDGVFDWGNYNAKFYKNTIMLSELIMEDVLDTLRYNKSYDFYWVDKEPLQENETVLFSLESPLVNNPSIGPISGKGSKSVHADILQLINIAGIDYTMHFKKYFQPKLDQPNPTGGKIQAIYHALDQKVFIK